MKNKIKVFTDGSSVSVVDAKEALELRKPIIEKFFKEHPLNPVKIHIEKSLPSENKFCKQFGLTRNGFQRKGVAFDAEDAQGFRWEFKHDRAAEKTGNHYLETAQTNDGGITWVHSGFSLSLFQAKYYVVLIGQDYLKLETELLDIWLEEHPSRCKPITTRPGVNGNREGQFSKGLLVKIEDLLKIATVIPCK